MDAAIAAPDPRPGQTTSQRPPAARRILATGLALGVLADVALHAAPDGLGWTLWVLALALGAWYVTRQRQSAATREELAWLATAIACATAFSWRDADELRGANVLGTLVALAMFAMAAAGLPAPSILAARVRDVISAGIYTIRDLVVGAPLLALRDAEPGNLPAVRGGASWSALRAVLLTVPLVLVFAVLLSRADPVFASIFRLPALDMERIFQHVVIVGAFSWWSAGWLRGALLDDTWRPALPPRLPLRLGLAEVTTSLGAVVVLFAVFVALQLRWLFGGAEVVLATTGLTVAEYARRGFFELVTVAVLVLPLILATGAAIDDGRVARRHQLLSLALLVLLAAIIASALLRMRLYVGHFGLTEDRLYATALVAWLAVVSLAMSFTVLRGRAQAFAAITLISGFATLGALNVLNPDRLVAQVNLARASKGEEVDYDYLARLGGDAMPTVVPAFLRAAPSPEACKAATSLRTRWLRLRNTSWNVGGRRGRAAVVDGLSADDLRRLCAGAPPAGG